MKKTPITVAVLAAAALATGCDRTDPCAALPDPTADQVAVAEDRRIEVEREVGNTECVVDGDRWVNEALIEDDDEDQDED